jgi:hypothetical protein
MHPSELLQKALCAEERANRLDDISYVSDISLVPLSTCLPTYHSVSPPRYIMKTRSQGLTGPTTQTSLFRACGGRFEASTLNRAFRCCSGEMPTNHGYLMFG